MIVRWPSSCTGASGTAVRPALPASRSHGSASTEARIAPRQPSMPTKAISRITPRSAQAEMIAGMGHSPDFSAGRVGCSAGLGERSRTCYPGLKK